MWIAFENPLNESALAFPILECIHIVGFAVAVGTIALVDFRLLGFGLRQNAGELAKTMAPWTLFGLILVLLSGPMLFSSDPDMYYLNPAFQAKMVLLLLAIVSHYTIRRKLLLRGEVSPGAGKILALTSMALWTCVIFGGIFIAFIVTPGHE